MVITYGHAYVNYKKENEETCMIYNQSHPTGYCDIDQTGIQAATASMFFPYYWSAYFWSQKQERIIYE